MGWVNDLFKRKPGGTTFGNVVRTVVSAYTGGALGQGSMMISQLDADKRDMSDDGFYKKYGVLKKDATPQNVRVIGNADALNATGIPSFTQTQMWALVRKYAWLPISALLFGLALMWGKKTNPYGR